LGSGADFVTVFGGPFAAVNPVLRRRAAVGETATRLRDRTLDLFSVLESEPDSSPLSLSSSEMGGGDETCCLAEAERVTGPK
jgi:hypothetical protein